MSDDGENAKPLTAIQKQSAGDLNAAADPVPAEYVPAEKVLQKLEKPEVLSLAAFFSSKMTLGPDPESAKLMAETEMHHETCRLEGYKENLKLQEAESQRDHDFRKKRLNHDTFLISLVLVLALSGAGCGLYLTITDHAALGSNLLIAAVALIYYVIGGKSPFHKNEE